MSASLGQAENILKNAGCWMACKIFREAVREVRVTNISRSEPKGSWVIFPLALDSWQEELCGGHSYVAGCTLWGEGSECWSQGRWHQLPTRPLCLTCLKLCCMFAFGVTSHRHQRQALSGRNIQGHASWAWWSRVSSLNQCHQQIVHHGPHGSARLT